MDTAEFGFQRLPDVCPGGSVQDSLVRSHDNAMKYVSNPEVTRVLITGKLRFCASAYPPTNGDSETNRLNLREALRAGFGTVSASVGVAPSQKGV